MRVKFKWIFWIMSITIICFTTGIFAQNVSKSKEFRLEKGISKQGQACIECHKVETPGLFVDWANSRHAHANISCIDGHQADPTDPDVNKAHFKQYERSDNKWG